MSIGLEYPKNNLFFLCVTIYNASACLLNLNEAGACKFSFSIIVKFMHSKQSPDTWLQKRVGVEACLLFDCDRRTCDFYRITNFANY